MGIEPGAGAIRAEARPGERGRCCRRRWLGLEWARSLAIRRFVGRRTGRARRIGRGNQCPIARRRAGGAARVAGIIADRRFLLISSRSVFRPRLVVERNCVTLSREPGLIGIVRLSRLDARCRILHRPIPRGCSGADTRMRETTHALTTSSAQKELWHRAGKTGKRIEGRHSRFGGKMENTGEPDAGLLIRLAEWARSSAGKVSLESPESPQIFQPLRTLTARARRIGEQRNIMDRMNGFAALEEAIVTCERCQRLRAYCRDVAVRKKREFRQWEYWGKPVPGFGDPQARLWIVGLAPAAHGANRTGRVFTGDKSGEWLYGALHRFGFSSREISQSRDDGLRLEDAYISSAARCAPPGNKPLPQEIGNCAEYLDREFRLLTEVRLFLALGSVGYSAIYSLISRHRGPLPRPRLRFAHNALHALGGFQVLCSYHPSRQNTQTGRLTRAMWLAVFKRARSLLDQ